MTGLTSGLTTWTFVLITVCAGSCGDVLCASAMSQGEAIDDFGPAGILRAVRYIVTRRKVILGGICYAAAFFSLLGLLSTAELSIAVPATALSFVLDTLAARFILHEHVPRKRWAGVACVCVGVLLAVRPAPLPGPGSASRATVQAHQDQAGHDESSAHGLDDQSASSKILAEP
jgi:drug/metabolite transporter (DMT)-like permease